MKPRVLIVDDEPDYLDLVEFSLLREGFEVVKAANGLQALHLARRHLPNVIVLDLMLPDLDGFSVCEILRAQPSTSDVPVIFLSAMNGETARKDAARFDVSRCFTKGIDLKALAEGVRFALEQEEERLKARLQTEAESSCRA